MQVTMPTPGVLIQAGDSPGDLRPIAYISGLFPDMQQKSSATEKEAFPVYQSVLKFHLYLRGVEILLHCNHKLLESFLSKDSKIHKLSRCSMKLADCNITFVHIRGKNNVLADATSRLKMLDIYKEPMEHPEMPAVSDIQT